MEIDQHIASNPSKYVGLQKVIRNSLDGLLIYYGYPSSFRGYNDNARVIDEISSFYNHWVVGDGNQAPAHQDYANTTAIISGVKANGVKVYGYVPIGTSTSNRSLATMQAAVDQWATLGVNGIFLDEFGFDYQNTRTRQKAMVDYVHSKGLVVVANAWIFEDFVCDNISELTWQTNDWRYVNFQTYNPTNIALTRNPDDIYLVESFCYSNVSPLDQYNTQEKMALVKALNATKKVKIWAVAVFAETTPGNIDFTKTGNLTTMKRIVDYVSANAYLFDIDALGFGGFSYGASGMPIIALTASLPVSAKKAIANATANYITGTFQRHFGDCVLTVTNLTSQGVTLTKHVNGLGNDDAITIGGIWEEPTANGYLIDHIFKIPTVFPTNLSGSELRLRGTVAAANMVFTILHLDAAGATLKTGTATILAGESVATFSLAGGMTVLSGQSVQIKPPTTPDATGRNVTATLLAERI